MTHILRIFVGIIVLLGLVWGVSKLLSTQPTPDATPVTTQATTPTGHTGSIILTLKPTTPTDAPSSIYRVPVQTGTPSKLIDGAWYMAPALSKDGVLASVATHTGTAPRMELRVAPMADTTRMSIIELKKPVVSAGASSWSHDGGYIAYEGTTPLPSPDDLHITNSRITLLERSTGEQIFIDTGTSPLFLPDDSIVYIKHDGVYRVTRERMRIGVPSRLWYTDVTLDRSARLAISSKNMLALTNPNTGEMTIRPLDVGESPHVDAGSTYKGVFFWPTFSPDGSRVAVVEFIQDGDTVRKELRVLNLTNHTMQTITPLDVYDNQFLSIGAWIL